MQPEQQRHVVRGLELAVQLWEAPRARQRVLAWPGWLDNAASCPGPPAAVKRPQRSPS